ncbi:hypothetical protein F5J12DRAFT_850976 [Pisolithus orientalis]|uniref:uncharacterized protein n=1 Tax=Pisolithus orientalis TaxID=936130 RepID=UPI0022246153|nr:uncharacterized protein F5J12DRAFT_850976 [Pisolithus orientalis]KAI5997634.1 hypothetical protein F5J12DRAFT_850976 [Pisolithus orientalis]
MTYTEKTMKGKSYTAGKPTRGALFTVVQRNLAQNKTDIVDSLNYMGRFHWMYRAATEINDRVCMAWVYCSLLSIYASNATANARMAMHMHMPPATCAIDLFHIMYKLTSRYLPCESGTTL